MKDASKSVWAYSAFSILFGLILLRVRRRDLLRRVFENRVIGYLGKISYGLYLFHLPIIRYISARMGIPLVVDTPMSANRVYSIVLSLVVTVAISIASFELFERHFLALKDVFFAKKAPGANVAAVSATV
ncbi:MAG: acyltransferase family protein [Chthoniobacterales bacterium]|nr:acyltransferase family protein [Chthoniobacterales bacterium]